MEEKLIKWILKEWRGLGKRGYSFNYKDEMIYSMNDVGIYLEDRFIFWYNIKPLEITFFKKMRLNFPASVARFVED